MASRNIADLSPAMQVYYNKFNDRCRRDVDLQKMGCSVLVTCTYRSGDEQDRLYAQGRTAPGAIVTNAKAGKSAHNATTPQGAPAAAAFDVVPVVDGKPVWDGKHPAWAVIGAHGKAVGLKWYGDPDAAFHELPHFQDPDWRKP